MRRRRFRLLATVTDAEAGRALVCIRCGEPVLVFELPTVWLAEDAYVCGTCLEPKRKPNPSYDMRIDYPERYMRDGVWQVDV